MSFTDTDDDIEFVIDYDQLQIDSEPEEPPNPNANTLMCSLIISTGICKKKKCNFAHTLESLTPRLCKYDRKCRISKCLFIHTKESKEQYCSRLELVIPEKQKPILKKKQKKSVVIKTTKSRLYEDLQIAMKINNDRFFSILIEDEE
jgi:hypothetical protein